MSTLTVPNGIADAKRLAYQYRAQGVIVLAFGRRNYCGHSYGMTRTLCDGLGRTLDAIADRIAGGSIPLPDLGPQTPERIAADQARALKALDAAVSRVLREWEEKYAEACQAAQAEQDEAAAEGVLRAWLRGVLGELLMLDRNGG